MGNWDIKILKMMFDISHVPGGLETTVIIEAVFSIFIWKKIINIIQFYSTSC